MSKFNFTSLTEFERLVAVRAMIACADKEKADADSLDIKIEFNGAEVDFHKFCESFAVHLDSMVSDAANSKIAGIAKLQRMSDLIDRIVDNAQLEIHDFLTKDVGMEENVVSDIVYGGN